MQKIPTLFVRDITTKLVTDQINPGAEWVAHGEGRATRKLDGTCCMVRAGRLYKRYEVKRGGTPPANFEDATGVDPETGKIQGWVPVGDGPEDRWHREAFRLGWAFAGEVAFSLEMAGRLMRALPLEDGTYELIGPKVQGNPEGALRHVLIRHGECPLEDAPRTFDELRAWLDGRDIEGIVWHHSDGRMVKLKGRDFGFKRSAKATSSPT